ncbi:hypothetical protein [Methanohalophilus sp.]|uniref:hypothetical protein n=1 Tax=Methanohalophilus sp. TaxID=1966352 RepID=UPI0026263B1B|nr:hypothetical protein [Methanohalophilus sp.]
MPQPEDTVNIAVKELIVGFGAAEGLWIHTGVNPLEEILNAFTPLLQGTHFEYCVTLSWILIFVIIPIFQILLTYAWGGILGLLALLMAFIGGIFISNIVGIFLVFAGILLGIYSFSAD